MKKPNPAPSLYIHVPFCARKCEYCAFYSETNQSHNIDRYISSLLLELERLPAPFGHHTIFFGGGTPSILTLKQWDHLLKGMNRLGLLGAQEWTVECNPATVSLDKARLLREAGVNRISMGVQSLDENLLNRLGRIHSRDMVFRSFDTLRQAGFENINVDLMFAIPGQSMEIWKSTLAEASALQSEHLSCYEVIYEEDTPLFEQLQAGEFDVDEDLACAMYEQLIDHATNAGFHQYEIANFGRGPFIDSEGIPARACRHNVNYWSGGQFLAAGPSAAGFIGGIRTKNWSSIELYCSLLESGKSPLESNEEIPPIARAGELAGFGLRMNRGWDFETFSRLTSMDLRTEWNADMNSLLADGLGARSENGFRLTRKGLRFADLAAEKFLRPQ